MEIPLITSVKYGFEFWLCLVEQPLAAQYCSMSQMQYLYKKKEEFRSHFVAFPQETVLEAL
jgi:hypothetical protein